MENKNRFEMHQLNYLAFVLHLSFPPIFFFQVWVLKIVINININTCTKMQPKFTTSPILMNNLVTFMEKKIAPFKCISISIKSTKQNYIVQSMKRSTMIILKIFQTECIIRQGLIYPWYVKRKLPFFLTSLIVL